MTGEEKHFSSWIYAKKNNMMLFFALSHYWHDVILFLCLMCKSFHISSKIDPVYPIITLSHHPHFCSGRQNILYNKTIESIYTRIIHFLHDVKTLHGLLSDDAKK